MFKISFSTSEFYISPSYSFLVLHRPTKISHFCPQMFMTFYELWQKMGSFLRYFPHCTEVFIASHLFHFHGHGGHGALTKASGSDDVAIDVLRCAGKVGNATWRCCDMLWHVFCECIGSIFCNSSWNKGKINENHGLEYFGHDVITEFYTFNIFNVSTCLYTRWSFK